MSDKKWLTGIVVLLAMIVVVITPGSLGVFASPLLQLNLSRG